MRGCRGVGRAAVLVAAALAATAGVALAGQRDATIPPLALTDPVGDATTGPDLSAVNASVSGDVVTLSATLANEGSLKPGESIQFFLATPSGGQQADVAAFASALEATTISRLVNGQWQEQHYVQDAWSGDTLTVTLSLSDLQNVLQAPVQPLLELQVGAYVDTQYNQTPVQVDAVPNSGWAPMLTAPPAANATTTTTASPAPAPTGGGSPKPAAKPALQQAIRKLPRGRVEWTKLRFVSVPAGSTATIACTAGCVRSERLAVKGGTAASRRFVGVPFARGAGFLARVTGTGGTGWWFRWTVNGKGATGVASTRGCILAGGELAALTSC